MDGGRFYRLEGERKSILIREKEYVLLVILGLIFLVEGRYFKCVEIKPLPVQQRLFNFFIMVDKISCKIHIRLLCTKK